MGKQAEVAATLREMVARLLDAANRLDPTDVDVDESGSPGAALIGKERVRQITDEGYTHMHDAAHTGQEIAWAAFCYLERATNNVDQADPSVPLVWPFNRSEWKPKASAMRNLTIAGALVAAELDRRWREGERP